MLEFDNKKVPTLSVSHRHSPWLVQEVVVSYLSWQSTDSNQNVQAQQWLNDCAPQGIHMLLSRQDLLFTLFLSWISLFLFFPISFSVSVSQLPGLAPPLFQHVLNFEINLFYFIFCFYFFSFPTCPFLLLSSNTSPSWSPAAVGVSTCPPLSSSAAGWGGRGQWQSDVDQSFSGAV